MQDDSGLRKILRFSGGYRLLQNAVGAPRAMRWLAANLWRIKPGDKIVDIGCGLGTIIRYLPDNIRFVGIDISDAYIKSARLEFGTRAEFLCGTAHEFLTNMDDRLLDADVVMCNGLLHHLVRREVDDVLTLARRILSARGRFVLWEPTFLAHQGAMSRWFMQQDRGRNIRTEREWRHILHHHFPDVRADIVTGLLRIPYIHVVGECGLGSPKGHTP